MPFSQFCANHRNTSCCSSQWVFLSFHLTTLPEQFDFGANWGPIWCLNCTGVIAAVVGQSFCFYDGLESSHFLLGPLLHPVYYFFFKDLFKNFHWVCVSVWVCVYMQVLAAVYRLEVQRVVYLTPRGIKSSPLKEQ